MTVSIIIAVKTWAKNLEECVSKCLQLDTFCGVQTPPFREAKDYADSSINPEQTAVFRPRCQRIDYPDFEIIILPDNERDCPRTYLSEVIKGTVPVQVISTGPLSPAQKRDLALIHTKGEILAFIDDDAYPRQDWLMNAVKNFEDPEVAAVGGPAVTPESDNIRQKASGLVYASSLVSGKFSYRYIPKERQEVDDYPSCNFLVRKSVMQELGGFNTNFWPGEDTKLCLDITRKLGKKIIYDPQVSVWHHRRQLFMPHLKQVASYALHRGYFVKKYPQTSLRLSYFLPSLFIFGVASGAILSLFFTKIVPLYFSALLFYLLLTFIASFAQRPGLARLVFPGIMLTHGCYGLFFIKGLLASKLTEERR